MAKVRRNSPKRDQEQKTEQGTKRRITPQGTGKITVKALRVSSNRSVSPKRSQPLAKLIPDGSLRLKAKFDINHSLPDIKNAGDVVQFIRHNPINSDYFNYLKNIVTFPDHTISELLHISSKTFVSYRSGETLPKGNTQEQALMIISLYKHAEELFDTNDDFSKWLNTPNFFFDNQKPITELSTISGIRYVDDRLTAMQYGDNI